MTKTYSMCRMSKPVEGGVLMMVSWIPTKVAVVGNVVRLKNAETGAWTEGWHVDSTSTPRPAAFVERNARTHLKTRKASDI